MNGALDAALVGAAIAASLVYAALALGPRAWRRRCCTRGAQLAARLGLGRVARRLERAASAAAGGCGGCGGCAPPRARRD